jgi:ABC-type Fe3+-citrate transport system substrate-binding protein
MEQKLNAEIKALEYRKIWDEANKTEKTDFAASWFKEKKTDDKLTQHKKDLTQTKKKIKALKQIIEKDSLERVKIEPITL